MSLCMNFPLCLSYEHITAIKQDCGIVHLHCLSPRDRDLFTFLNFQERSPAEPVRKGRENFHSLLEYSAQSTRAPRTSAFKKNQNLQNILNGQARPAGAWMGARREREPLRSRAASPRLQGLGAHDAHHSGEPDRGHYSP